MKKKPHIKGLTTTQLLSIIKQSSHFSEVTTAYHDKEHPPEFCHFLYETMSRHKVTPKDMINRTGLERSYFYHILSGQKHPGRNTILRIGLCMSVNLKEMNQLLRLSNQGVLYPKVRRDAAIIFSIEKGYSMQQANDFLLSLNETPLYKEELS